MNILPKKRWHVRNRENIARVRKDEAEAAEKEKEVERRRRLAEQEAKIKFMRSQTQQKYGVPTEIEKPSEETVAQTSSITSDKLEHVNFFKDLEDGAVVTNATNKEHEQETKEEKEKYEKQIGYLTYLGQDTNEATGKVSWYEKPRVSLLDDNNSEENDVKKKSAYDPVHKYKHFFDKHRFVPNSTSERPKIEDESDSIGSKKKKHRKHQKGEKSRKKKRNVGSSSSSSDDEDRQIKQQKLLLLRDKRLKREREEKARAAKLLARMRGEVIDQPVTEPEPPQYVQKYNSQFNPHLAKQNAIR